MEFTSSAFGDKVNDRDAMTLILGLKEGNRLAAGFDIADLYPSKKFLQVVSGVRAKLEKIHVKIDRVLQTIVDSHVTENEGGESEREGTKEDLVDVLLRLQKSGTLAIPIRTDNIKAVVTVSVCIYTTLIDCYHRSLKLLYYFLCKIMYV